MGVYGPPILISPPVVEPVRFGLFGVSTVIDNPDPHALNGVTYKSLACEANLAQFQAVCPPSDNPVKEPTDGDRAIIEAENLIELYAYLNCKETTLEALKDEARAIFTLGEARAFEAAFWEFVLAQPTAVTLNTVAGPAGALSVTAAIAALESYMGCNYPGRPVFHSDRGTVPYAVADDQLIRGNGALETTLGSGWAAYACSPNTGPDGTEAPEGHAWIYATSRPTIYRWDIDIRPEETGHMLRRDANGALTNEPQVLAERSYLPFVDCTVAAVLVCLGACE